MSQLDQKIRRSETRGCITILIVLLVFVVAVFILARYWLMPTLIVAGVLVTLGLYFVIRNYGGDRWIPRIIKRIFVELINSLPPDWKSAELVLEVPDQGMGSGLRRRISNLEGLPGHLQPSKGLRDCIAELELRSVQRGSVWIRLVIRVKKGDAGWRSSAEFAYPNEC